ncbi:hypothetical protein GVN16_10900 [Emticicia sp. CRIBPO]|uniref:hypothetical protein n=1 Tax=Emticicia sp. CRIBPO TaxID=2683258 RepID=UPI001412C03C|nr:hypothetical protein [Emticicia sp. CRIBPO]NBA86273.1 hypothetical protein [Emticicia sp. CRIBPO]
MKSIAVYDYPKLLSGFIALGVLSGVATIFWLPSGREWLLWMVLVLFTGLFVSKNCFQNYFAGGFYFAVILGMAITATHLMFLKEYLQTHHEEAQWMKNHYSPYLTLLLTAPLYWLVLGFFSGLSAMGWKKVVG